MIQKILFDWIDYQSDQQKQTRGNQYVWVKSAKTHTHETCTFKFESLPNREFSAIVRPQAKPSNEMHYSDQKNGKSLCDFMK